MAAAARRLTRPPNSRFVDWGLRTLAAEGDLTFAGRRVVGQRLLADDQGNLTWILNPPQRREWTASGVLGVLEAVDWSLAQEGGDAVVRCAPPGAVVDVVELGGAAARAFEADASEPMTIVPSFRPLGGPGDLSEYLVGDRVLTGAEHVKWPVEQAALYLYRVARLRGGAFWEGVAAHVADATARRVEQAPGGRVVCDHWDKRETHVRFVADAALLLQAHAELTGEDRHRRAAARAADALESFGVPLGGGTWYLHDSVEEGAGRNDLVLNTHLHALTALHACGRSVDPGRRALAGVLGEVVRGRQGIALAAGALVTDAALAVAPRRVAERIGTVVHGRLAARTARDRALRLPGGYIARDVSGDPAPPHYLAVNLSDLAVLQRNVPDDSVAAALRAGLRYARVSGYLRGRVRAGDGIAAMLPGIFRNAGDPRTAQRLAGSARAAGVAPLVGWPGYEDSLWLRLAGGTP
jgi:hypothetical protein